MNIINQEWDEKCCYHEDKPAKTAMYIAGCNRRSIRKLRRKQPISFVETALSLSHKNARMEEDDEEMILSK